MTPGVRRVAGQSLDSTEDISVHQVSRDFVKELLPGNQILQALNYHQAMADNYLEKKMEQLRQAQPRRPHARVNTPSLDTLLKKNRSHRSFDAEAEIPPHTLEEIVSVVRYCPSGMNAQPLRFHLVRGEEVRKVHPLIRLGAALRDEKLPRSGEEPTAYIAVCAIKGENKLVDIDLGIALQSMLLKAVELGFNGVIVLNFDAAKVQQELMLPTRPLALLALGKGLDRIFLLQAKDAESLSYYRKDGVHYVPKLGLSDIII